jgi:hypothetical protein
MAPARPRLTEGMSGDRGHGGRRPSERAVDPDLVDGDVPADLDEALVRGVVTKADADPGLEPVHDTDGRLGVRGREVDPGRPCSLRSSATASPRSAAPAA